MRLAAAAAGGGVGELAPEAEAALRRLADAWLDGALGAACGAARRRRADQLAPDDAVTYLERTWRAAPPRGLALPPTNPNPKRNLP